MNLANIALTFSRQKDINGQLLHKLRLMRVKLIEPNKIEFVDSLIEATVQSNNTLTEMRTYIEQQSAEKIKLRTQLVRCESEKKLVIGIVGKLTLTQGEGKG